MKLQKLTEAVLERHVQAFYNKPEAQDDPLAAFCLGVSLGLAYAHEFPEEVASIDGKPNIYLVKTEQP